MWGLFGDIELFSKRGDVILDPYFGSGTLGIACVELKRNYIGIDISSEYCELAKRRIGAIPQLLPF